MPIPASSTGSIAMGAAHPDRPAFAFRIGVVGNRWDKLGLGRPPRTRSEAESGPEWLEATRAVEERLRGTVERILATIAGRLVAVAKAPENGYSDAAPRLAVVSGLAEGADRIVASAGL